MLIPSLESGGVLFSRAVASQVPSALRGLTSVFGMGTGGSLLPSSPELLRVRARFVCSALSLRFLRSLCCFRFHAPSKPHSEKLTSKTSSSVFSSASLPLLPQDCFITHSSVLSLQSLPPLPLIRSEPSCRPISIGKLQHCCSYTADLSPHRL